MRILHVADLHLDSPFVGMGKEFQDIQKPLIESSYTAFERCVSVAINRKVDVMVIVGDIYDSQKQTVKAQHFFQNQLERLYQAGIPVALCHGNHDYMTPSLERRKYPDNVHVFRDDKVSYFDITTSANETLRLYGFSYKSQWVSEPTIDQFPKNPDATQYTIGLLHGDLASGSNRLGNYAPFTLNDLLDKNYDYWALGHIHQAQVLNTQPLIQYSGTIQGRHRNESGPKGAYIIELDKNQPSKNEFIELSPIIWKNVNLECQIYMQASELIQEINQIIANFEKEALGQDQSFILEMNLIHAERLDEDLQKQVIQGQVLESVDAYLDSENFVVVSRVNLVRSIQVSAFEYDPNLNKSFEEAFSRFNQSDHFNRLMSPIASHPTFRTYLSDVLEQDEISKEIISGAREIVVQSLGFDEEIEGDVYED